jgi:hypothetical protein
MMATGLQVKEFDSTLIRRGRRAVTFPEMVEFAATLETRPIIKLLEELPDLARLSEAKFSVASSVLRRRFRGETPVDQQQLKAFGYEIAARVFDASVADRIRSIFA